jgi:ribonuclease D
VLTKQGRFGEAIQHYGAALLPAKLEDLSDSECLVMAQHQLEEVLESKGRTHRAEDIFRFRRAKHVSKTQPAAAHDMIGRTSDTQRPVEQAALGRGVH